MQMITIITLLLPLAMAAPTPISEPALQPMAEPIKRSRKQNLTLSVGISLQHATDI